MTPDQKAAYVIAMAACAQIEAMAMIAHNSSLPENHPSRYTYAEFVGLAEKHGIHHNAVLSLFHGS